MVLQCSASGPAIGAGVIDFQLIAAIPREMSGSAGTEHAQRCHDVQRMMRCQWRMHTRRLTV